MTKGISIVQGQVILLALDGTLVYVEAVERTHIAVVALPEQLAESNGRIFRPGCVGAKKISPFAEADKEIAIGDLSERNKKFIGEYEQLRKDHGPTYVDRTPAELAAHEVANAPKPTKSEKAAARAAAKASKGGPRYLQRCVTCGEQPGHPCHDVARHTEEEPRHAFTAPAAPSLKCLACDEDEDHIVHGTPKEQGGHKFVGVRGARAANKPAKEPRAPKAEREPRRTRTEKPTVGANRYRWIGDDMKLGILRAVNPKYSEGNSGAFIVDTIKAAGTTGAGIVDVMGHAKSPSTVERAELAFQQLLRATLIERVTV